MSLAAELKEVIRYGMRMDIAAFVVEHQDAILAALRGRDAVLEEAAKMCRARNDDRFKKYGSFEPDGVRVFNGEHGAEHGIASCECGEIEEALRAMKEGKHV